MKNRRFFPSDPFPDKHQFGAICLERFQLPAASDEIEKLHAIGKADETFRPDHVRGQSVRKTFEAIAGENVV